LIVPAVPLGEDASQTFVLFLIKTKGTCVFEDVFLATGEAPQITLVELDQVALTKTPSILHCHSPVEGKLFPKAEIEVPPVSGPEVGPIYSRPGI